MKRESFEIDIPVHSGKNESDVMYFVGLDFFKPEVQEEYIKGNVYGAYETKSRKVYVTLHGGKVIRNARRK